MLAETTMLREGRYDPETTFMSDIRSFTKIPGSPLCYWLTEDTLSLFVKHKSFTGLGGSVQIGLSTQNDPRFLRLSWEIPLSYLSNNRIWFPFAKGGEYSKFYQDVYLMVNWRDRGGSVPSSGVKAHRVLPLSSD